MPILKILVFFFCKTTKQLTDRQPEQQPQQQQIKSVLKKEYLNEGLDLNNNEVWEVSIYLYDSDVRTSRQPSAQMFYITYV